MASHGAILSSGCLWTLRDLLQRLAARFDADREQRKRGDQERQRKGVQDVGARSVSEHEADDGWGEERADPADAEEPADRRGAQMRRMQFADVNAGRTVDA